MGPLQANRDTPQNLNCIHPVNVFAFQYFQKGIVFENVKAQYKHMARRGPKPPQMRIIIMTKQVNYGLHETLENSHRTLSDAVTMYAIYYSDWTEILEELSQYYKSDEWKDSFNQRSEKHVELVRRRNHTIREIQEIGAQLRSVGLDVDLCEWATVDDYFEDAA